MLASKTGRPILQLKLDRVARGLTQYELALEANMLQSRISMIEAGLVEPTKEERARLSSVLGVGPARLFRPVTLRKEGTSMSSKRHGIKFIARHLG